MSTQYRPLEPGEESRACELIVQCFHEFVADDHSPEGVAGFLRYAEPEAMRSRIATDHFALVAEVDGEIVGVIEIRRNEHISQLFVAGRLHGRGIGSELFRRALDRVRTCRPSLQRLTVSSTRFALPVYRSFGFRVDGPEMTVNGLTSTPMVLELDRFASNEGSAELPQRQGRAGDGAG